MEPLIKRNHFYVFLRAKTAPKTCELIVDEGCEGESRRREEGEVTAFRCITGASRRRCSCWRMMYLALAAARRLFPQITRL